MSTATARGLLPAEVSHKDAVFNASRSGLLVAAMTQQPERLLEATQDRLHQPYRVGAMPATGRLLNDLRARGLAAVVSGAGPTVLTLCDGRRQKASDVAAAAGEATDGSWRVEALGVDLTGVAVQRLADGLTSPRE
jgi:homoserine kinase